MAVLCAGAEPSRDPRVIRGHFKKVFAMNTIRLGNRVASRPAGAAKISFAISASRISTL